MASNLSSIGFHFANAKEFQHEMIRLAAESVERLECEAGTYAIWRSRTGAELWFHLPLFGHEDQATDIEGLTPWFEGENEAQVEIRQRIQRADDNAFEGAFEAWVGSQEDGADGGEGHPLVLDAVDFSAHVGRALPFTCAVRLTGFARSVRAFDDGAPTTQDQRHDHGRLHLAARAFVPIGMFAATGGGDANPTSDALLTGTVVAHHRHVNEVSGSAFLWLSVQSLACEVDVVADPAVVTGEIGVGKSVEVTCRLFGRLLD